MTLSLLLRSTKIALNWSWLSWCACASAASQRKRLRKLSPQRSHKSLKCRFPNNMVDAKDVCYGARANVRTALAFAVARKLKLWPLSKAQTIRPSHQSQRVEISSIVRSLTWLVTPMIVKMQLIQTSKTSKETIASWKKPKSRTKLQLRGTKLFNTKDSRMPN